MTEQEKNTWIAGAVYEWDYTHKTMDNGLLYNSWCKDGVAIMTVGDFNPYNDIAQAIEALEAWVVANCSFADRSMEADDDGTLIHKVWLAHYKGVESPNLAHAICDALVQATGGE